MPPETTFSTPHKTLNLCRYPKRPDEKLRAWDAADEYVLSHIVEQALTQKTKKILVYNDGFGALSLGLSQFPEFLNSKFSLVSDSVISHSAIAANATANKIDPAIFELQYSHEFSRLKSDENYDLVVIKIPKSLAQLEDNLRRIRCNASENTQIVGVGMVKHVHNSTLTLFEQCLGVTKTSLAKKKARLIFSTANEDTPQTSTSTCPSI